MKQLVIFDLDGTLLNTIDDLGSATNYALETMGYPKHPISSYPAMVGNGVTRLLQRAMPSGLDTDENVERMRTAFREYYDEHNTDLTTVYPGMYDLVRALQERGIKLAVASNKYHEAVVHLVRHFFPDIEWAVIAGQKEGIPTKPDPSIVFDILTCVPTPKVQVLYVGDSAVDMETARRACVESVGVTWGFRPVGELKAAYADHIVNTPAEILPLATRSEFEL
jgi:phosphoglycolate phosphatase